MTTILTNIQTFFQHNQILTIAMSLGGAGIVSFWLKDVPQNIYKLLQRELTTKRLYNKKQKGNNKMALISLCPYCGNLNLSNLWSKEIICFYCNSIYKINKFKQSRLKKRIKKN